MSGPAGAGEETPVRGMDIGLRRTRDCQDSSVFWILLAQGACRAVGPCCTDSRSPTYHRPLASLHSFEPLIPTSLRELHQRQAWLPTALICFRKPRAPSSVALFSHTEDNQKNMPKLGGRFQTAGGGCEAHPAAVRLITQASRATWEEETRNAGGLHLLCGHSCLSLSEIGWLGVHTASLPQCSGEPWLLLDKPGQICSILARVIYSGKTILIFKMDLLFSSFI